MVFRRKPDEPEPTPGPLGWFELTVEVMRDRSHSSWMLLHDDELLRAVTARRLVACHAPGAPVALPNLAVVRLAVSPQGRVGVVGPDGSVQEGDEVEDVVIGLLEELKTCGFIEPDNLLGPPWLPVPDIVEEAHQPGPDFRVVYAYRGTDTLTAATFATSLEEPLTVYLEDGWVISASPPGPVRVLTGPPNRISGAYPFAVLERRAQRWIFGYAAAAKSQVNVLAEWTPLMQPVPLPEDAGAEAAELQQWLIDPDDSPDEPPAIDGATPEQNAALARWRGTDLDGDALVAQTAAAFGVPELAVRLAQAGPEEALPEGGREFAPGSRMAVLSSYLEEQDAEPSGRGPWGVMSRFMWRHPVLGVMLGLGEILVGVVVAVLLLTGGLDGWGWWFLAVAFAFGGLGHLIVALVRLRWRRTPDQDSEAAPTG